MPPVPRDPVERVYREIQRNVRDLSAPALGEAFSDLYDACGDVLTRATAVPLATQIPNKQYVSFELDGRRSRAVNTVLFERSVQDWRAFLDGIYANDYSGLTSEVITRRVYSLAISFCAVIDLTRRGDQKTPGTFFEWLIGHLFAVRLATNPTKRLPVLNLDLTTTLPTDFIFDLGEGRPKFHLPVKTSTRERVIQVWAHQRVLDGVYGTGRFLGTPVILTETKTDQQSRSVVEICLPEQWRIYQMHIAQLRRVYYLDVPAAYARLNDVFPPLHVAPFGQFFLEVDDLVA